MNFYEYLQVPSNASAQEIKKAFRNKAKHVHPDHNNRDSAFFEMVELNLARDTLLNPSRRQAYDQAISTGTAEPFHIKPNQSNSTRQRKSSRLSLLIRELFVYRCRICGLEMSSTWQGYCLFHFLEVSGQLHNTDCSFQYHGYTYRYRPPEQNDVAHTPDTSSKPPSKSEILLLLAIIAALFAALAFTYLQITTILFD